MLHLKNYLMIFGKPRYLGLLKNDSELLFPGMQAVTESARGEEIAVAAGPITLEQADSYRIELTANGSDGVPRGGEPAFQDLSLVRPATQEDLSERSKQEKDEEEILLKGRGLLKAHELDMKLVDVEFLLDRKKLFFYFTAEQRIDFRAYVRDLAREFKTRIELRQIGVRDESKVVKGMSPCGMPCCCSYWLNRFAPICIRMVKEQNLALNPTKISGICGRLMCCMGFEHNTYRGLWKNLPGPGSKIKAPNASFIVSGVDVSKEKVRIYSPGTGEILVDIEEFPSFRETVMRGETWGGSETGSPLPLAVVASEVDEAVIHSHGYEKTANDSGCEIKQQNSVRAATASIIECSGNSNAKDSDFRKKSGSRRPRRLSATRITEGNQRTPSVNIKPEGAKEVVQGQPKPEGKRKSRRRRSKNARPPIEGN